MPRAIIVQQSVNLVGLPTPFDVCLFHCRAASRNDDCSLFQNRWKESHTFMSEGRPRCANQLPVDQQSRTRVDETCAKNVFTELGVLDAAAGIHATQQKKPVCQPLVRW